MMNKHYIMNLYEKINYDYYNEDIIGHNVNILMEYYEKLKQIYLSIKNISLKHTIIENNEDVINILTNKFNSKTFDNFISKTVKIMKIEYDNVVFYYLINDKDQYKKDINLINDLFIISLTLYKFQKNKKEKIKIIWVPINKQRIFHYDIINKETLQLSNENFEAFGASGLTFDNTTIITRYEEIKKLLLHELIHNFNLDGHKCNEELKNFKKLYNEKKQNNYEYTYDFYESYTELLSSYFNIIFSLIKRNINKKILRAYIIIEIIYSYNIIANLIQLNGYKNYDDFYKNVVFKGDICMYEYYYVKALMYNNFKLSQFNTCSEVNNFYKKILDMNKNDKILKVIYHFYEKKNNFKYSFV